jgi:hypothetical protein
MFIRSTDSAMPVLTAAAPWPARPGAARDEQDGRRRQDGFR